MKSLNFFIVRIFERYYATFLWKFDKGKRKRNTLIAGLNSRKISTPENKKFYNILGKIVESPNNNFKEENFDRMW